MESAAGAQSSVAASLTLFALYSHSLICSSVVSPFSCAVFCRLSDTYCMVYNSYSATARTRSCSTNPALSWLKPAGSRSALYFHCVFCQNPRDFTAINHSPVFPCCVCVCVWLTCEEYRPQRAEQKCQHHHVSHTQKWIQLKCVRIPGYHVCPLHNMWSISWLNVV